MNELVKILGIAVAGGAAAMTVRRYNNIYGMLTALALGVFIVMSMYSMTEDIIKEIYETVGSAGINKEYIIVVLKVIGTAYLSQFGAEMLRDGGESALASKCETAGRIFILYLTMPAAAEFLRLCAEIAEGI